MRNALLAALAALATACGPDLPFVGSWNMTYTSAVIITVNGTSQTDSRPGTTTLTLRESTSVPTGLEWNTNGCDWSALATTDSSFTVNRNVCPPTTKATCPQQLTLTVTQGTGTRTGNNLAINTAGTVAGVCDTSNVTGSFSFSYAGSKVN